jgi:hypothetical protein
MLNRRDNTCPGGGNEIREPDMPMEGLVPPRARPGRKARCISGHAAYPSCRCRRRGLLIWDNGASQPCDLVSSIARFLACRWGLPWRPGWLGPRHRLRCRCHQLGRPAQCRRYPRPMRTASLIRREAKPTGCTDFCLPRRSVAITRRDISAAEAGRVSAGSSSAHAARSSANPANPIPTPPTDRLATTWAANRGLVRVLKGYPIMGSWTARVSAEVTIRGARHEPRR